PLSERTPNGQSGSEGARLKAAVDGAKAGDSEAIRYLYIRHAGAVHRYVRGIVRDEFEAEDITQAVFTKLFKAIEKYEPRDVPFAAWLRRVARNLGVDGMRRRRRRGVGAVEGAGAPRAAARWARAGSLCAALRPWPCDQPAG